jgi:hypothetical protein
MLLRTFNDVSALPIDSAITTACNEKIGEIRTMLQEYGFSPAATEEINISVSQHVMTNRRSEFYCAQGVEQCFGDGIPFYAINVATSNTVGVNEKMTSATLTRYIGTNLLNQTLNAMPEDKDLRGRVGGDISTLEFQAFTRLDPVAYLATFKSVLEESLQKSFYLKKKADITQPQSGNKTNPPKP